MVDRESRVIKGGFYNGHHPLLLKRNRVFDHKLKKLFVDLFQNSFTQIRNVREYARDLVEDIFIILENNSNIIPQPQLKLTKSFVLKNYKLFISQYRGDKIKLSLSHGDINKTILSINAMSENLKRILIK